MNAPQEFIDHKVTQIAQCRKVFGWLFVGYVLTFYVPIIILGTGIFEENKPANSLLEILIVAGASVMGIICLVFALKLASILAPVEKWLSLPLIYLLTFVPFFGMI